MQPRIEVGSRRHASIRDQPLKRELYGAALLLFNAAPKSPKTGLYIEPATPSCNRLANSGAAVGSKKEREIVRPGPNGTTGGSHRSRQWDWLCDCEAIRRIWSRRGAAGSG